MCIRLCRPFLLTNNYNKKNEEKQFCIAAEPATSDEQKNVSDAQLANLVGVTRQTVNNIINGHSDPHLSRLHAIAEALGVRVRDLFCE